MKKIERVLLTFSDKEGRNPALEKYFFGIAKYLEYKLNLHYDLQKVQFLNIHFRNKEFYDNFPNVPKQVCRWEFGIAEVSYTIDFDILKQKAYLENINFIWKKTEESLYEFLNLKKSKLTIEILSSVFKNEEKLTKVEIPIIAFEDDNYIFKVLAIFDPAISSSLIIYNKITNSENQKRLFDVSFGEEYFMDMFKNIFVEGNNLIIKGKKDAKIFPIIIPLDEIDKK